MIFSERLSFVKITKKVVNFYGLVQLLIIAHLYKAGIATCVVCICTVIMDKHAFIFAVVSCDSGLRMCQMQTRVLDARKKSHLNVPLPTTFPGQGCKESLELTRNILREGGRSIMVSR